MARFEIDKNFYYKLNERNELYNAANLTRAELARTTKVSFDILKMLKYKYIDTGSKVEFDTILTDSFNQFEIFDKEDIMTSLNLLANVDCMYHPEYTEFDRFGIISKLCLFDTGAYNNPKNLYVTTNLKKASSYYLSHEICHMLKEMNRFECEYQNNYLEVVPMLMELIFSYNNDCEGFNAVLNNRIKKLKILAREYIELYKDYVDVTNSEDKVLYLSALNEKGKYIHSFYYTLILFQLYISDSKYFGDKSNKKFILDKVSDVLLCKCTTKDMLEDVITYINNVDAVYEDSIDTVNDIVFHI